MNLEELIQYCNAKPNATESLPFGPDALVFKVYEKIFAITALNEDKCSVSLKCDPDYALELREKYEEIIPGFHLNKKHWNTVSLDGRLKTTFIKELIDHSYQLVLPVQKSKKTKS